MSKSLSLELEKELSRWLSERDKLDVKLKNLQAKRKSIDEKINDLNKAHIVATGRSYSGLAEPRTAADLAEELLKEFGELHVDKMLDLMSERQMQGNKEIPKQSLVATLVRYSQQNKKFRRVEGKPNTFALIKGE